MTDPYPTAPTTSPPDEQTPLPPRLTAQARQDVTDTVQRIMGEPITTADRFENPPAGAQDQGGEWARSERSADGDGPSTGDSATDVAKDQAGQVADTAKQAGAQVAETVKDQAAQVTAEAGQQAKQLLSQAQSELTDQAAATQQRVADGLRALAHELTAMAGHSDEPGPATDLARQAADKAQLAAAWLGDRDPGTLLDDVRSFARRKPGTYLALALGAGIVAGRLTRGLTAPDPGAGATPRHRQDGVDHDPVTATDRPSVSSVTPAGRPDLPPLPAGAGHTEVRSDDRGGVSP